MEAAQNAADPLQPVNELEMLNKMEDERLRLQRQVRIIQTDRQHRTMGVHPQFRRQDELLMVLKKEYINYMKDLKIARSGAHKKKDKKMKQDLKQALLLRTQLLQNCEGGVTVMNQLDDLLQRDSRSMLLMKKLAIASRGQLQERQSQSENRLVSAENKLEAAMLRFNTIRGENMKIRDEIEHMLKDRAIFNQAWTKMLNALCKGKKFLTDLFESSTVAYDQRDEWCAKLKSMLEKGRMDQKLQVQEMRDLQKTFDHDMKLHDFLAHKGVIRINKRQEQREEDQKLKAKADMDRQIDEHVRIVEDINGYTKEQSTTKIIENFVKVEQENLSVYKLLTSYCAENEALSRDVKRIRGELEDRRDWNEMKEEKRQKNLEELKAELQKVRKRTEKLRQKCGDQEHILNRIMEKIEEMFKMLDCSCEPFQNLLGDKEPSLWRSNLTLCLITERIKELVQIVYYYERFVQRKKDPTSSSRLKRYTVHAEPPAQWAACPINLLVPADPCPSKKDPTSSSRLKRYTVHAEPPAQWAACPINLLVPADPCPSCVEARWLSRVSEAPEVPFDKAMARSALAELAADPAFERSDRIHAITDCRLPHSRAILARRYL